MGLEKQKNIRLATSEDRKLQKAARAVGLTDSQWIRLVVRVALGETLLLEQLTRVAKVGQPRGRRKSRA
jgi:hypothetical protein